MKKPPDKYKCIKKQIKDVFTDINDINKIHNAVKRSNQVYIKVLMLLKIYTLQEYELLNTDNVDVLPQLPLITNEMIGLIQRSVCLSKTNGKTGNWFSRRCF